jgi:integration host factor subunit beta
MTKSELIGAIASGQDTLSERDVELAVKVIVDVMSDALASGERIEIRGFGSFSLHSHPARTARNPRTGAPVALPKRFSPYFRPGKELRERVNASMVA